MSAGPFSDSKYSPASNIIYRCRVQPETIDLEIDGNGNIPPLLAINQRVSARASSSTRSFGCTMNSVSLRFTGTPPAGYSGDDVRVPILNHTVFADILPGSTGTYLGVAVSVVGKIPGQER